MPSSAIWKASFWNCVLPAIVTSIVAVFIPETPTTVSTSSKIRPTTSVAPVCKDFGASASFMRSFSVRSGHLPSVAQIDGLRHQETPERRLRGIRPEIDVGVLVLRRVVAEAVLDVLRAHAEPDSDREDHRVRVVARARGIEDRVVGVHVPIDGAAIRRVRDVRVDAELNL